MMMMMMMMMTTMMMMIQRSRTGHAQAHLCCKHILRGRAAKWRCEAPNLFAVATVVAPVAATAHLIPCRARFPRFGLADLRRAPAPPARRRVHRRADRLHADSKDLSVLRRGKHVQKKSPRVHAVRVWRAPAPSGVDRDGRHRAHVVDPSPVRRQDEAVGRRVGSSLALEGSHRNLIRISRIAIRPPCSRRFRAPLASSGRRRQLALTGWASTALSKTGGRQARQTYKQANKWPLRLCTWRENLNLPRSIGFFCSI